MTDRTPKVFDVRDYGAVGDGVTDDASAIQTAIDACNRAGGDYVRLMEKHAIENTIRGPAFVKFLGPLT